MTLIMRKKEEEVLSDKFSVLYQGKEYYLPKVLDYLEHNPYSKVNLEEIVIGIIEGEETIMPSQVIE